MKRSLKETVLKTVWKTLWRREWFGEWDDIGHKEEEGQRRLMLVFYKTARSLAPGVGWGVWLQGEAVLVVRSVWTLDHGPWNT